MEIIKEADFRKEIKSAPRAAYLFFGEEDYMKAFAIKKAQEAICPDPTFAFFNEIHLDALSYSHDALLDSLMPLPMMADRKLITVSGLDINAMRSNELDDLCAVMAKLEDYDYNTVILNVASDKLDIGYSLKKPSAQLKKLGECAILVNFEKNSPSKLAAWLAKHFEHNGVAVSPQICTMIIDRCGRDMYNLAGESEKLSFYAKAHGRNEILPEDVTLVTSPLFEYDSFAFANAICARRKDEALEILRDMKTRRIEPVIILAEISKNVCEMCAVATLKEDGLTSREISEASDLHEFRVSLILKLNPRAEICRSMVRRCREADIELKSSRDGYGVIEKLICTI